MSGQRKFFYKEWEYSISVFERLRKSKPFSVRFRLEYSFLLINNKTIGAKLKSFIFNWLAFLNLVKRLFLAQVIKKQYTKHAEVVFFISNNPVYLQHLSPVLLSFIEKKREFNLYCPGQHVKILKEKLAKPIAEKLIPIESFSFIGNRFQNLFLLIFSILKSLADAGWFVFRNSKSSILFSSSFARYSLSQHFFNGQLLQFFSSKSTLLAANDHWMWESLLFTSAKEAGARTFICQHGVTGEISYPIFADKFLSWGEYEVENFVKNLDAKSSEIMPVGSPYFDNIYRKVMGLRQAQNDKEAQQDKTFQNPYIVFLSQPFIGTQFLKEGEYEELIYWFYSLEETAKLLGKKLLIKLHPGDKEENYSNCPESIEITREPLEAVLPKSCITMTLDSTAIFESVFFEVPALQIATTNQSRYLDFSVSGLTVWLKSGIELAEYISKVLSEETTFNQQQSKANLSLNNYYFGLGNSLERFEELVYRK